ncbi:hypothetical protein, partial [Flavobacterium davisii]|uniref:hypothetical protein n=1 Tax=Flavobacterium davisii TaxID=2906077 RepID=UPI001F2BB5F2
KIFREHLNLLKNFVSQRSLMRNLGLTRNELAKPNLYPSISPPIQASIQILIIKSSSFISSTIFHECLNIFGIFVL